MFQCFYPDRRINSTYDLSFEDLYRSGYRGLIFDIDNTLVPHGAPADDRAKKLFVRLREIGFHCCLMSNNHEPRVKMFNEEIQAEYIFDAHKPSVRSYREAMRRMGTDVTNTLFIGDQLFTDIHWAKRAGLKTILVNPIHPKEEIQIVFKRYLEKIVLFFYERSLRKEKGDAFDGHSH